jgi:1-acyl-sn-glycerol-3-phosphate acyltransferase
MIARMITPIRSALFAIWFVAISVVVHLVCLPLLLLPPRFTCAAARVWARLVMLGLKWLAGLGLEIRGKVPDGPVLVASKHFSAWETIALMAVLRHPSMVMKKSLLRLPVNGWYSRKMRMLAVDREAGASALRTMAAGAAWVLGQGRPVVIFPEGTRKKLHDQPDYKSGVAALYTQLHATCVPAAHNSGLFWTGAFLRKPGTITLQFLEPIPPGLSRREFMATLQTRIEAATEALLELGERQMAVPCAA